MLLRTIAVAVALVASPALAFDTSKLGQGGSLALSEIDLIIAKSPQLQREINQGLLDGKKAKDDVICSGMRFPGQWQNLGGLRVGPYTATLEPNGYRLKPRLNLPDARARCSRPSRQPL
jgi:hypothetical protein